MKTNFTYALPCIIGIILFSACTKSDYYTAPPRDEYEWMRTHEKGSVAYVEYRTGNYIVETYNGYSVIESWGGTTPREYDQEYAWFSNRGVQSIYNFDGNYYTKGRIIDTRLSWQDALYILDQLNYVQ